MRQIRRTIATAHTSAHACAIAATANFDTASYTYAGSPPNRGYTNANTSAATDLRARDAYPCAYAGKGVG